MLFGALPALKHAAQHGAPLGGAARGASASRERQRTRNSLVVVQVALALVLLVGVGPDDPHVSSTAQRRTRVCGHRRSADGKSVGASAAGARAGTCHPDAARDPGQDCGAPGVTAAAFASAVPMEGPLRVSRRQVFVEGQDYAPGTTPPLRRMKTVSPGYFGAIGTRMIAGRDITWSDIYGRAKVAIVSENFAREVWGSPAAALGQRIRESAPAGTARLARDRRRRRGRPRGCAVSGRTGVGVLAGHDGELRRRTALRRRAPSIWSSAATRPAARACLAASATPWGRSTRACRSFSSGR